MVKRTLLIINMLLFCIMLNAADGTEDMVLRLDINQSIEMAIKNNLNLENNNIDLKNTKYDLISSYTKFLSASSELTLSDELLTSNSTFEFSFSAGASISIKSIMSVVQNVTNYKKNELTYKQAKQSLQIEIKKYYYKIIRLEKEIELSKYNLDRSKSLFEMAQLNYKNGMISEIDKLQAEYSYKSLIPKLDELQEELENHLLLFAYLLGINYNQQLKLTSDFPDVSNYDVEKITVNLIDDNLDLQILSNDLQVAQNGRNTAIANFIPDFNLQYSVATDNDLTSSNMTLSQGLSLSIVYSLDSILPFSQRQTEVIQKQNNIKKVKNIITDAINTNKIKFQSILSSLNYMQKKFDNYNLNIKIAGKKYEMIEKLYNKNSTSYLELQEAKNDLNDAKLALLNKQYDFLVKLYELESLINKEIIR